MKICKNNFDIHLYNIYHCINCSFKIGNACKWLPITRDYKPLKCGGVKSNNLSDIFTL